jgi:FMN phosphatase YigB (HAD superfamily)
METLPNYVLTQDTESLFERINDGQPLSRKFLAKCDEYFTALQNVVADAIPGVNVQGYSELEMNTMLTEETRKKMLQDPQRYCICLDRYLLSDIEQEFPERFFRFSITRTAGGTKVPRAMDVPFEQQVKNFAKKFPNYTDLKGLFVDDGVFSGGTVKDTLAQFTANGVQLNIESVLGFVGDTTQESGKQILKVTENLFDWIDIRDFSPLGGKTKNTSASNRVASAIPYLFPWSDGSGASLNTSPELFSASKQLIQEFSQLVAAFERTDYGKPILFRDLVKRGFPLPTTNMNIPIPVSINDSVTGYLERCARYIEYEQQRPVFIFDMDGTLYQLDGQNNKKFAGSSLEKAVEQNAISFIINKESCSYSQAQKIYTAGLKDSIGVSRYLSNRYNITRQDYFNEVWNIDPTLIIRNYEIPVRVMRKLKEDSNNKLILLTAAPSAWAKQVIGALGLTNTFELVFTGEQYGKKDEIFKRLAAWYEPNKITSAGDQLNTDIEPARRYGLQTLLVNSPNDLEQLISPP